MTDAERATIEDADRLYRALQLARSFLLTGRAGGVNSPVIAHALAAHRQVGR